MTNDFELLHDMRGKTKKKKKKKKTPGVANYFVVDVVDNGSQISDEHKLILIILNEGFIINYP